MGRKVPKPKIGFNRSWGKSRAYQSIPDEEFGKGGARKATRGKNDRAKDKRSGIHISLEPNKNDKGNGQKGGHAPDNSKEKAPGTRTNPQS